MLTRNLWVDQGLTNGSMGQVHEISLDGVARPRVDMPSSVLVVFRGYTVSSSR